MYAKKILSVITFFIITFVFPGAALAAVDAESVISGKCTACHSAERIRESSKSKSEWKTLVDEEIDRGAQLSRAERTSVIDWLARNYGATAGEVETVAKEEPVVEAAAEPQATEQVVTPEESLPFDEQAETGIELWQLLFTGGALMASGAWVRRR